jgi:hypothetical protein
MNAQDNQPAPHDPEVLAAVDRVLDQSTNPARASSLDVARASVPDPHMQALERFCSDLAAAAPRSDPAFRELLGRRLTAVVDQRRQRGRGLARSGLVLRGLHASLRTPRRRLVPVALAALVAAGGIGTYLHNQGPTPVSAQTVLQRAAAVSPGTNEAAHSTYRLSASGGVTGTADLWVGSDASGVLTQFALTQMVSVNGRPAPELSGRLVETDRNFQVYDPATNTVTTSSWGMPPLDAGTSSSSSSAVQNLEGILVGAFVSQKFTRAMSDGMQPSAWNLQRETLNGVSVYALNFDPTGQTFYFNTQSYALEGGDWTQGGRSWQARLDHSSYQTTGLSSVPAHTFTLNAPANATVVTLTAPAGAKRPADDRVPQAAAAACGTTADAIANAQQAGDKSLLAICQETSPTMTADRLVTAILVPFKADLDAQVSAGTLTPQGEATALANLREKLTAMVTSTPGSGPAIKKP